MSQKDAKIENPEEDDIYKIGTICKIKQILKLPGNTIRVLVEGVKRGRIAEYIDDETMISGKIEVIEDDYEDNQKY